MAHNINETEVELPTHAILTPPPSKQISDTRERPFCSMPRNTWQNNDTRERPFLFYAPKYLAN